MNRAELTAEVAAKSGVTKKDVDKVLCVALTVIRDCVCGGGRVSLNGFGTFELKCRRARKARNPLTKELISLPETRIPSFRPCGGFKDCAAKGDITEEL